jgi:IS5 family transposase
VIPSFDRLYCIHGDKGYRGHNHPDRFKAWITGQVRHVTKAIHQRP